MGKHSGQTHTDPFGLLVRSHGLHGDDPVLEEYGFDDGPPTRPERLLLRDRRRIKVWVYFAGVMMLGALALWAVYAAVGSASPDGPTVQPASWAPATELPDASAPPEPQTAVTLAVPGPTVTVRRVYPQETVRATVTARQTVPGPTVTVTRPRATATVTATSTRTVPGPTMTVTERLTVAPSP